VFGFGGTQKDNSDVTAVLNDVASVSGGTLKIDAAMKLTGTEDEGEMCADFLAELLQ
jgi:hypothetical protein